MDDISGIVKITNQILSVKSSYKKEGKGKEKGKLVNRICQFKVARVQTPPYMLIPLFT